MNINNVGGGGGWARRIRHASQQRADLRGGQGKSATVIYVGNLSLSFARRKVRDLAGLLVMLRNNFDRFDAGKQSDHSKDALYDETHVNGSSVY